MIDKEKILELLTEDKLIEFMKHLGSERYKKDKDAIIFESICHASSSMKLYYYINTKTFHCYSGCSSSYSIFDLISQINGTDFYDSFKYLANFLGIDLSSNGTKKIGFKKIKRNNDLKFLKIGKNKAYKPTIKMQTYNDNILQVFDKAITQDWLDEGISLETAEKFELRFYQSQNCMVVPVRNIEGELIGIRKRNYFKEELEQGKKYVPIVIQNTQYKFPTALSLYGIYQNKDNIKKLKRVILFESEKSVLKYDTMYETNITLSIYGMSMSKHKAKTILELGVEEVVIALDKQYIQEDIDDINNKEAYNEFTNYLKKLKNITNLFERYSRVSVMIDFNNLIQYKDSPIDNGRDIFEELYKNRISTTVEELEKEIELR